MTIKITAELVKQLRDSTGVSVMQCKNALEESEGDMEKALIILKKKSSNIAMKKAGRIAQEGIILTLEDENKVLLFTLNSETDFVARNEDFINLANKLANIAWNDGITILKEQSTDLINGVIQKLGEKIELGRVELIEGETIGSYVHGGKSAVIVSLNSGTKKLAKDIAMHIAAMKPVFIKSSDITKEDRMKVTEVFKKEVESSDKTEEIKKKMLDGKISTYFKEQTLMDQIFIKNSNLTIDNLLKENNATFVNYTRESIS